MCWYVSGWALLCEMRLLSVVKELNTPILAIWNLFFWLKPILSEILVCSTRETRQIPTNTPPTLSSHFLSTHTDIQAIYGVHSQSGQIGTNRREPSNFHFPLCTHATLFFYCHSHIHCPSTIVILLLSGEPNSIWSIEVSSLVENSFFFNRI